MFSYRYEILKENTITSHTTTYFYSFQRWRREMV